MKSVHRLLKPWILSLFLIPVSDGISSESPPKGTQAIPLALVQRGIPEIHDFSLSDFARKIEGIGIISTSLVRAETGRRSETRSGAAYLLGQNLIVVPQWMARTPSAFLSQFMVHESLGAIGYNDDHYRLSGPMTALSLYGDSVGSVERQRLLLQTPIFDAFRGARPATSRELDLARRGGGTHAGGGGEIFPFLVRTTLDFYLLLRASDSGFAFDWARYTQLEIENVELKELLESEKPRSTLELMEGCPGDQVYLVLSPAKFIFNRPTPEQLEKNGAKHMTCAALAIFQELSGTPNPSPSR